MMIRVVMLALVTCREKHCRRYEACIIGEDGEPMCQCPTLPMCEHLQDLVICATNGLTYVNRCLLRTDECSMNRPIRVLHRGACRQGSHGRPPYRDNRSRVWDLTPGRRLWSQPSHRQLFETYWELRLALIPKLWRVLNSIDKRFPCSLVASTVI